MKVFIDGFSFIAHSITQKLINNHNFKSNDLLVNTYNHPENIVFNQFLTSQNIKTFTRSYKDIEMLGAIKTFEPDLIISLYGRRIIPEMILNFSTYGSFNLHPSLLPNYKGCFSCPWVIINQEEKTGITIHEMVSEVDAGNILYQEEVIIARDETAFTLYNKLADKFISIFDDFFTNFLNGNLKKQQMDSTGSYYPRLLPYNGYIDITWNKSKIESFIRAMHFPPHTGALLKIGNDEFEVDTLQRFETLIKL
tara:strand:+ start:158 stop:913 length:756 start_codon:yes stop_codon:yes gene_type:complete